MIYNRKLTEKCSHWKDCAEHCNAHHSFDELGQLHLLNHADFQACGEAIFWRSCQTGPDHCGSRESVKISVDDLQRLLFNHFGDVKKMLEEWKETDPPMYDMEIHDGESQEIEEAT